MHCVLKVIGTPPSTKFFAAGASCLIRNLDKVCSPSVDVKAKAFSSTMGTAVESWNDYFLHNKDRLVKECVGSLGKDVIPPTKDPELSKKVAIWRGDITKLPVDAIVNAANTSLLGGGGVDGAIHRAAGPKLLDECRGLKGCQTGNAKITKGYNLPAKHVIHTVGPRGEKPDLLESCYQTSLKLLVENNLRTVAFPCISTGIYGYPQEAAAHVAIGTVRKFLEKNRNSVDQVIFCLFLPEDVKIYETLLQKYFPN